MTITIKQRAHLRALIRRHVATEVAMSWLGGQPPEDHAAIELESERARLALDKFINQLVVPNTPP